MSILPQLERDLVEAAASRLQQPSSHRTAPPWSQAAPPWSQAAPPWSQAAPSRAHRLSLRLGGLRLALAVLGTLLAGATIALAAGGVILTGAPVRSRAPKNPDIGNGVPAPGASRLLPLSVPDPEGGLPWGMRIVGTTRGESCLQIGRLENGQLGELGLDGAFHDDGRFHPMSPSVLPAMSITGGIPAGDSNTSCQLAGKALAAEDVGLDRGAAEWSSRVAVPRSALRDIDYGVLGPQAVSVTYRVGGRHVTVPVAAGTGAYLIVRPVSGHEQTGGGGSIGTYGDLPPYGSLSAISYRIDGKLCQRGPVRPPWVKTHIANECPWPHWPSGTPTIRDLHRPLHVHLQIHHNLITGMDVSFVAPLAIDSAAHEYAVQFPDVRCNKKEAPVEISSARLLERDVRKGATLTLHSSDPFASSNGCTRHSAPVKVVYYGTDGSGSVLVGSITVEEPSGTKPAPMPRPRWRRLRHRV